MCMWKYFWVCTNGWSLNDIAKTVFVFTDQRSTLHLLLTKFFFCSCQYQLCILLYFFIKINFFILMKTHSFHLLWHRWYREIFIPAIWPRNKTLHWAPRKVMPDTIFFFPFHFLFFKAAWFWLKLLRVNALFGSLRVWKLRKLVLILGVQEVPPSKSHLFQARVDSHSRHHCYCFHHRHQYCWFTISTI